jgi:hypothetical protein
VLPAERYKGFFDTLGGLGIAAEQFEHHYVLVGVGPAWDIAGFCRTRGYLLNRGAAHLFKVAEQPICESKVDSGACSAGICSEAGHGLVLAIAIVKP